MKKITTMVAIMLSCLLFFCMNVEANEIEEYPIVTFEPVYPEGSENVDAGFSEFVDNIECTPIYEEAAEQLEPITIEPSKIYVITDEDSDLILRIASLEAGNQGIDGMAYVMQVILNRFENSSFPNSIEGVIYQDGQFCTAKRIQRAEIKPGAYEALELVKQGDYASSEALYFESCAGKIWSKSHTYLFTHGNHDFYK